MLLKDLLGGVNYEGNADIEIKDIVCDSRKVGSGSAFVCIKGYETDGHIYAEKAAQNGAKVIIAEHKTEAECPTVIVKDTRNIMALLCARFYGNPSKRFKLIGITGTNGKTTTTYLIKNILEKAGKKVGLIGTNHNMIADEIIETKRTTPDSFELQALFKQMADKNVDAVVMEVSSHALFLDRVAHCDFDIGVFTNLTQDHLDFHKTMENYADAKAILFKMCKCGIVNIDDKYADRILKNATANITTFGIQNQSDLFAHDIVLKEKGVEFKIGEQAYELHVPGKFSVYNSLCAIGVAKALEIDEKYIVEGLKTSGGVKGRAQVVDLGLNATFIIDYAHTPDGVENILNTVRGFAKGRVVVLFGCGGDRDNKKRPVMGEIADRLADFCIVTSDNPRTENPAEIISQIVKGMKGAHHVVIENRREAIKYAVENAKDGDVVVLAGKGHETYQTIGKENFPFDEEKILFEIKNELGV
ncbi:MAG: UDP-N-acetylmuramoyl-L-alanyl-D-glutamate--2,6-diaminopimelate ligase [Clostridia bacterium]|nr:UDP-N-acetylmuramoyl-L-alanyl-D-glutamate--2,6-diaminopimelate ligase [Clostridia bacterium]